MAELNELLHEMDSLLDMLIDNAKKLLDISKQVISEEELEPLQKKQHALLKKLIEKDEAYHQLDNVSKQDPFMRENIDAKLDEFQQLNASFIDNITTTHGMIQFEKGKVKTKTKKNKPQ